MIRSDIPFPTTGSYPARAGNRIHPLIDSGPAFRRICQAIDSAERSVWLTVTFMAPDFPMPDGRGTILDVLDRAAARGLDVRVIFWRPNPESSGYGQAFGGSAEDRALLAARGSRFQARWDRAFTRYCHHQKSWLIDAGQPTETAFVGGINLTFETFEPGHRGPNQRHDAYVEVTGPAATDVHHNFVQRWNEASERQLEDGSWGGGPDEAPMGFPTRLSAPCGDSLVQIQRNIPAGHYTDGRPTPGGAPYPIAAGEHTIVDQYIQAIDAARRSIYIENQALPIPAIAARLESALGRGVTVALLVPAEPESHDRKGTLSHIEALGRYPSFTLLGIAGRDPQGDRSPVYVHDKIMLVDDTWATIGSCNLHRNSLTGHTEMNASFRDAKAVQALRCALLQEHLDRDTAPLDDIAALALCREIAEANRRKQDAGDADWQGLAFAIDPAGYGY
jgi:cardiolipin synthase